jgi:hypothetical protein
MEGSDQLLAIAEIGATFAGFTGVIGVLGRMPGRDVPEMSRVNFWLMIEFALVVIFFCLIPFAVFNFTGPDPVIWITSSAIMAAFIVVHLLIITRVLRPIVKRGEWPRSARLTALLLFASVFLVQFLNAIGVGFTQSYQAYFLGLLLFLAIASVNFVALMRAIWANPTTPPPG